MDAAERSRRRHKKRSVDEHDDLNSDLSNDNNPSSNNSINSNKSNKSSKLDESSRPRVRITRACNECRRRKDRCDGQRPACESCRQIGHPCSYNPSKKRGLRTGYVRALEILLGLVFGSVNGTESWVAGILDGQRTSASFCLAQQQPEHSVETIIEVWRKSSVLHRVETLLTEHEDDTESNIFDCCVTLALSRKLDVVVPPSPIATDTTDITSPTSSVKQSQSQLLSSSASLLSSSSPPRRRPLPSNWSTLLDIYFSTTHSWLPISQKQDLLRPAYVFANSVTDSDSVSDGDLAFLMAALTYASCQAEPAEPASKVDSLLSYTLSFFPAESERYDIGHARALLVLALLRIYRGQQSAAWFAVGRATYVISASLYPSLFHEPSTFSESTRRTILCCVALDTLVASWVRARPYFHYADIAAIGLLTTNDIEEWEPWRPASDGFAMTQAPGRVLSTFNSFIELIGVLNSHLRRDKSKPFIDCAIEAGGGGTPQTLNLQVLRLLSVSESELLVSDELRELFHIVKKQKSIPPTMRIYRAMNPQVEIYFNCTYDEIEIDKPLVSNGFNEDMIIEDAPAVMIAEQLGPSQETKEVEAPNVLLDTLMSSLSGELNEDGLFQSLAELDSNEWYVLLSFLFQFYLAVTKLT